MAGDHTLGKLALYMLNLIRTLNVIMEKSDTDFTGVLTSTRSVPNSPLQIGRAVNVTVILLAAALVDIFRGIYTGLTQSRELLVWICTSGTGSFGFSKMERGVIELAL